MYNEDILEPQEEIEFPWLVFKLNNNLYTVNSKIIASIVMVPERITKVPNVPEYLLGLIHLRGNVIPLIDLRVLFNTKSIKEEYDEFDKMIEDRKYDFVQYVEKFERAMEQSEKFKLGTDVHECAFGKWNDNYKTDIEAVSFHVRKMHEPHKAMHEAIENLNNCLKNCESCENEKCLKTAYEEAKETNMPYLLNLLDEVKEIFRMHYKEMVIVLENENSHIGIIADEVLSVENIVPFEATEEITKMCRDKFVSGVAKSEKSNELLLILDDEKIMEIS